MNKEYDDNLIRKELNIKCATLIKQIATLEQTRIDNEIREYNLGHSQAIFLDYIYKSGKKEVPLKKVQDYLLVSRPSVSAITSRLVEKGFITTKRSKSDNRTKLVTLTKKGEQIYTHLENSQICLPDVLNQEELECLYRLLSRIQNSFCSL